MNLPTLDNVQDAMVRKGYAWFTGHESINLVGIRHPDERSNKFNDWMTCTWCDDYGHWTFRRWPCTTEGHTHWVRTKGTTLLYKPSPSLYGAITTRTRPLIGTGSHLQGSTA